MSVPETAEKENKMNDDDVSESVSLDLPKPYLNMSSEANMDPESLEEMKTEAKSEAKVAEPVVADEVDEPQVVAQAKAEKAKDITDIMNKWGVKD